MYEAAFQDAILIGPGINFEIDFGPAQTIEQ